MLEIISRAMNSVQAMTSSHRRNVSSPVISHRKIGTKARPAPAGAGTPVLKPADLCGCSAASMRALNLASRSAQQTASASAAIHPNRGAFWSDQRKRISAGAVPKATLSLRESSSAPNLLCARRYRRESRQGGSLGRAAVESSAGSA